MIVDRDARCVRCSDERRGRILHTHINDKEEEKKKKKKKRERLLEEFIVVVVLLIK